MPHYCVNCGAVLMPREIEGRTLEACPNDEFVLWRDPKVATAVVVEVDGGLVLGRRAIEPGLGEWCLPGGFVNDDEGPLQAAARECREEIGARVEVVGLVGVYHIAKEGAPSLVGVGYHATVIDGEHLEAGPEMLELAVFPFDALPALAFPSHREVLREFVRYRARQGASVSPGGGAAARRSKPPSRARARSQPPRRP